MPIIIGILIVASQIISFFYNIESFKIVLSNLVFQIGNGVHFDSYYIEYYYASFASYLFKPLAFMLGGIFIIIWQRTTVARYLFSASFFVESIIFLPSIIDILKSINDFDDADKAFAIRYITVTILIALTCLSIGIINILNVKKKLLLYVSSAFFIIFTLVSLYSNVNTIRISYVIYTLSQIIQPICLLVFFISKTYNDSSYKKLRKKNNTQYNSLTIEKSLELLTEEYKNGIISENEYVLKKNDLLKML